MMEIGAFQKADTWVVRTENRRPLAIVGKGRLTREYAPWNGNVPKDGWDIWTYNEYAFENGLTPTAMFEMHEDALTTERYKPGYQEWLREEHPFTIWMHEENENIPAGRVLAWREISDRYMTGIWRGNVRVRDFFTSTTPYALGLALWLGYRDVYLFGIELNATQDYRDERDCVFFWLGILNALGVDVHTHKLSKLFYEAVYPFDRL